MIYWKRIKLGSVKAIKWVFEGTPILFFGYILSL